MSDREWEIQNASHAEILSHLNKYGVVNKDRSVPGKKKQKQSRKVKRVRRSVNLHGLTSEEAAVKVRFAIESCRKAGIKELLIIHGRGIHSDLESGPVLKNMVKNMLRVELCMQIRHFQTARQCDGGEGATLVHLT
ncbi:DNA mismatch repair protein MutS [Chitinispirillum alkaliphilum]|nr:DNA mismatch repair protein MutS [Chitinispirillum alkaliphilum]